MNRLPKTVPPELLRGWFTAVHNRLFSQHRGHAEQPTIYSKRECSFEIEIEIEIEIESGLVGEANLDLQLVAGRVA